MLNTMASAGRPVTTLEPIAPGRRRVRSLTPTDGGGVLQFVDGSADVHIMAPIASTGARTTHLGEMSA